MGALPTGLEPHLEPRPQDVAETAELVPGSAEPLAVIHPGAGDLRRRWPPGKFAELGSALRPPVPAWWWSEPRLTGRSRLP